MNRKQIIIIVVLAVFVVIVIITGLKRQPVEPSAPLGSEKEVVLPEELLLPDSTSTYTSAVPEDIELSETKLEVPIESDPEAKQKLGVYPIVATRSGYEPSEIVVNQGDIVLLELTSQGGIYNLFSPAFGFYLSATDGKTEQISFKASVSGTFLFNCRDHCPSGKVIKGQLIVLP